MYKTYNKFKKKSREKQKNHDGIKEGNKTP